MSVRTGLERLVEERAEYIEGCRVGLLCHPASVDRELRHASELLAGIPGVELASLFGPQHGLYGHTQDNMVEWEGSDDPETGVPVRSLYGEVRKPKPEWLEGVDVLVVDLQEVGTRVYTFASTLALCLESCAEAGVRMMVADRPNPIGGELVEGPLLEHRYMSFVGMFPGVPMRHGMTFGELALLHRERAGLDVELDIVAMEGWGRSQRFRDTGLQWVLPSPNMPIPETAEVYPGTVHLEGTNASEGRGTTRPFELVGAPFLTAGQLVEALNGERLPGVRFRPHPFEPTFQKHARMLCGGVQIHVTDPHAFRPVRTGYAICRAFLALAGGQFAWTEPPYEYVADLLPIDVIAGTARWREAVEGDVPVEEVAAEWEEGERRFLEERQPFLLYE
jgi:uncharacterized protein YbbC (DUF1343 family)